MNEEKKLTDLFWIDMEMTGLHPERDRILEVAAVVTDLDLKPLDEFQSVVFQPPDVLSQMDEWCVKTHGESGLSQEVASGRALKDVEGDLIALMRKHFGDDKVVLCGNSVHQDRRFMERYMPLAAGLLHYRMIDVSSFKEIFRSKFGITGPKKPDAHRAAADIHESIRELAHYLSFVRES